MASLSESWQSMKLSTYDLSRLGWRLMCQGSIRSVPLSNTITLDNLFNLSMSIFSFAVCYKTMFYSQWTMRTCRRLPLKVVTCNISASGHFLCNHIHLFIYTFGHCNSHLEKNHSEPVQRNKIEQKKHLALLHPSL